MSAWMQTSSSRALDLLAADVAALDMDVDVARPLAGLARFAAHRSPEMWSLQAPIYSVAQHCVVGADAVWGETRSAASALAFLVHDAHEALIGDITPPARQALEAHLTSVLDVTFGPGAADRVREAFGRGAIATALAGLEDALDDHIHRAIGLPPRLPAKMRAIVKEMDLRMLDLERRQILGERVVNAPGLAIWHASVLEAKPVRIRGRLKPWPAVKAAEEWLDRLERWRVHPIVVSPVSPDPRRDGTAVAA